MDTERLYTIIVFSENAPGLISQISSIFTRRQVNIESINACPSSIQGIHRHTITCVCSESMVKMLTLQIEKRIEVLQARYYEDDSLFILEAAMFKISTPVMLERREVSECAREFGANFVEVNSIYSVLQFTGHSEQVQELFDKLSELGAVRQFVRTGRICIAKTMEEHLNNYLALREQERLEKQL